jgi:hypothetical protein
VGVRPTGVPEEEGDGMTERDTSRRQPRKAAERLGTDTAELVRAELDRAWQQVRAAAGESGAGAVLLAGAGLAGALARHAGSTLLLRSAQRIAGPRTGPALLAACYLAGAGLLGTLAVRRLRAAWRLGDQVVTGVRQDAATVTDTAR